MRTKYLYMEVTNDEIELPLIVAESLEELSKKSGRTVCAIKNAMIRKYSGRNKGSKFVKTELILEKEEILC